MSLVICALNTTKQKSFLKTYSSGIRTLTDGVTGDQ